MGSMSSSDDGWEARMAERNRKPPAGDLDGERRAWLGSAFLGFYPPDTDVVDVLPEIISARCLGISYGDPGPRVPGDRCRECWAERYVWIGNGWGLHHIDPGFGACKHACHDGEVWLAAS